MAPTVQCKTDVLLINELKRGHRAFDEPGSGFNVVRLELSNLNPVNVSALVLPSVWLLAAVRNLGSSPVTMYWSSCDTWRDCFTATALEPWPTRPIPALAGKYALPCRHENCDNLDHASMYHYTWLQGSNETPTTLEILTADRAAGDDTVMYTSHNFGVGLMEEGCFVWGCGMFSSWGRYCRHEAEYIENEIVRKARWSAANEMDSNSMSFLWLCGNQATRDNPGAHWSLLREWAMRIPPNGGADTRVNGGLCAGTRLQWNEAFKQYGGNWVLPPDPQYTMQSLRQWQYERACADGWWQATDMQAIMRASFVIKLQRAVRRCLADPHYAVCRRRLQREFSDMGSDVLNNCSHSTWAYASSETR